MVLNPHTIQSYCICCCSFSRFLQATFNLLKKNSLLETSIFLEYFWNFPGKQEFEEFVGSFLTCFVWHQKCILIWRVGGCSWRPPKQSHQEGGSFPEWPWHISWMTFACACCPLQGVSPGSMWSLDWGSHSLLPLPLKEAYSNDFPKTHLTSESLFSGISY